MNIESQIKQLKKINIPKRTNKEIDKLSNTLLKKMTIEEKIGQLYQSFYYDSVITGPQFEENDVAKDIKNGRIGSLLNVTDLSTIYTLQKLAIDNSPNHIPLMFMFDVIHGYKTMFPTPLAMACSFNPELIKKVASAMAYEASHTGINITFSPMLDIVKDPRWGRVNESNGEDPYLNEVLAKAYVTGFQGKNVANEGNMGACCKHYLGYGAVNAGRDYNYAEISDLTIYQEYLPGFKQAVKNDCLGVMFAFMSLNHQPMTQNKKYTVDVLRKQLKFNGFTISDCGAVNELIYHKVAKNDFEAAKISLEAGVDQEMASTCYRDNLLTLCKQDKKYIKLINNSCLNILKTKYKLGLFDDPFKNIYPNINDYFLNDSTKELAYKIALQSIVCLKNDNDILPININKKISLIGPFAKSKNITGAWSGNSLRKDNISIYEALKENNNITLIEKENEIESAKESDICILCLGEDEDESGEANSKTDLSLPEEQVNLLKEVYKVNKNIILVLCAGRPLVLTDYLQYCQGILFSFFLGNQSGNAIRDILFGKESPSGKLSMSFPRNVGQLPMSYITYPTGRPKTKENANERYISKYIDSKNSPLYPFSYGISYNKYSYSNFKLSKDILTGKKDYLTISFDVTNNGNFESDEITFLFIEALYAKVTRPSNELKAFKRIHLLPNETKSIEFKLTESMLRYYNQQLKKVTDEGNYLIKIGTNLDNLSIFNIEYKNT